MSLARPRGSRPSRRAILAGAAAFAFGSGASASAVPRVACLEWTAAELILTLGVTPIAIGDVRGYRDWVVEPALSDSVLDLGTRFEPNLEVLRELAPDLIVATRDYGLGADRMRGFGAVVELTPYATDMPAIAHAERQTREMAARLGREHAADAARRRFEETVRTGRERLGRQTDPICLVSLFEGRTARIYGTSGLMGAVMERLGLRNGWDGPANRWGFASVGLDRLALLPLGTRVVSFEPIPVAVRALLDGSALWRDLPFVRAGRFSTIAPIWPFGGLAAATRLADLLSDALAPR